MVGLARNGDSLCKKFEQLLLECLRRLRASSLVCRPEVHNVHGRRVQRLEQLTYRKSRHALGLTPLLLVLGQDELLDHPKLVDVLGHHGPHLLRRKPVTQRRHVEIVIQLSLQLAQLE